MCTDDPDAAAKVAFANDKGDNVTSRGSMRVDGARHYRTRESKVSDMPNLVENIHHDHINTARVLDLIEKEIEQARREQMPDLDLVQDAMRYLTNYSDLVHHRMEDSMFARLLEKEPSVAREVEVLKQEHEHLAKMGADFLEIVKAAQSGEFISRDEVVKRGSEYVGALRSHMDAEEVGLLKRAKASLSDADLEDIGAQYASTRDPLMEESLKEQYGTLYRSLME
ncbi:MAG: hemerythrin domain-containing protein [Arenicellales bacterium]